MFLIERIELAEGFVVEDFKLFVSEPEEDLLLLATDSNAEYFFSLALFVKLFMIYAFMGSQRFKKLSNY